MAILLCIYTSSAQTDSAKKQVVTDTVAITAETSTDFDEDDDKIFTAVEVESKFPGGGNAWKDFLSRNLRYPARAIDRRIEGTVTLQFIVCKDGTVCDVEAISGPAALQQAAIDAMKNTPKWVPALQNGIIVKSYKKQAIIFKLRK